MTQPVHHAVLLVAFTPSLMRVEYRPGREHAVQLVEQTRDGVCTHGFRSVVALAEHCRELVEMGREAFASVADWCDEEGSDAVLALRAAASIDGGDECRAPRESASPEVVLSGSERTRKSAACSRRGSLASTVRVDPDLRSALSRAHAGDLDSAEVGRTTLVTCAVLAGSSRSAGCACGASRSPRSSAPRSRVKRLSARSARPESIRHATAWLVWSKGG